eukprot:scaffold13334_cov30-Tisochrysis_lutea.AAC.3
MGPLSGVVAKLGVVILGVASLAEDAEGVKSVELRWTGILDGVGTRHMIRLDAVAERASDGDGMRDGLSGVAEVTYSRPETRAAESGRGVEARSAPSSSTRLVSSSTCPGVGDGFAASPPSCGHCPPCMKALMGAEKLLCGSRASSKRSSSTAIELPSAQASMPSGVHCKPYLAVLEPQSSTHFDGTVSPGDSSCSGEAPAEPLLPDHPSQEREADASCSYWLTRAATIETSPAAKTHGELHGLSRVDSKVQSAQRPFAVRGRLRSLANPATADRAAHCREARSVRGSRWRAKTSSPSALAPRAADCLACPSPRPPQRRRSRLRRLPSRIRERSPLVRPAGPSPLAQKACRERRERSLSGSQSHRRLEREK